MAERIVILGGGIGGIVVANRLGRTLASGYTITLIDRREKHVFTPSFPWLMMARRKPEGICRDIRGIEKRGVGFVRDEVVRIEPERKRLSLKDGGDIEYDTCVVSLGAEPKPELVPGLKEGSYNLYEMDEVVRLSRDLDSFKGGRIVIVISSIPFKCPAAPYEYAMLLDYLLRQRDLRARTTIEFYTPEPLPMPVAGRALGLRVKGLIEERGIIYKTGMKITSVDTERHTVSFDDGTETGYDLLLSVPPHTPPDVIKNSPLSAEGGWIPVDPSTLRTGYEDLFAIGDVTSIRLPNGMFLPKAGVFAHFEAECVSRSIIDRTAKPFTGDGYCFIEMGGGRAGFARGNFYAEPAPEVRFYRPSVVWHWGKVVFEKWWLRHWF